MKRHLLQFTAVVLLNITVFAAWGAGPEIIVDNIAPLGQNGYAEGKVVWDGLTPENEKQYAVVVMLHALWDGGGGYYVKPYANNYLNSIENGQFRILITTGGIDNDVNEVIFFFVERSGISDANIENPGTMANKYLATKTINRCCFVSPPPPPRSNIRPGFVAEGTQITLSSQSEGVIRYTLDGTNPIISSTAHNYSNQSFYVSKSSPLLMKAVVKTSDTYSPVASLLWFAEEPLKTPLFGLNVSLALNGEPFGFQLSEAQTRERLAPIPQLTGWIRSFGTVNNGQPYINKIAKEKGLRTMIGLYITNDVSANETQIEGLEKILTMGPLPDLICVGNEPSIIGLAPEILTSCIDKVRNRVLKRGLKIPIGSVDVAGYIWQKSLLERFDFVGVNAYHGVWDNITENQMLSATKQSYQNMLSTNPYKFILLTEVGAPYSGGTYTLPGGGTQTASKEKAAHFLCDVMNWMEQEYIPAFYFEAYDEKIKSQNGGHLIEEFCNYSPPPNFQ